LVTLKFYFKPKKLLELAKGNGELAEKFNLKKLVDVYYLSLVNQSKLTSSRKFKLMLKKKQEMRPILKPVFNFSQSSRLNNFGFNVSLSS
jgi:hypothetical protein